MGSLLEICILRPPQDLLICWAPPGPLGCSSGLTVSHWGERLGPSAPGWTLHPLKILRPLPFPPTIWASPDPGPRRWVGGEMQVTYPHTPGEGRACDTEFRWLPRLVVIASVVCYQGNVFAIGCNYSRSTPVFWKHQSLEDSAVKTDVFILWQAPNHPALPSYVTSPDATRSSSPPGPI